MPTSSPSPDDLVLDTTPIDYGVITSGSCDTPEAQEAFDAEQMGKPPMTEPEDPAS